MDALTTLELVDLIRSIHYDTKKYALCSFSSVPPPVPRAKPQHALNMAL